MKSLYLVFSQIRHNAFMNVLNAKEGTGDPRLPNHKSYDLTPAPTEWKETSHNAGRQATPVTTPQQHSGRQWNPTSLTSSNVHVNYIFASMHRVYWYTCPHNDNLQG